MSIRHFGNPDDQPIAIPRRAAAGALRVPFDVPHGRLDIAGPPAHLTVEMVEARIPPGRYRVRVSGRGFSAVGAAGADADDSYRLRFWPRRGDTPAVLRRRWPGWEPALRHRQAEKARIGAARRNQTRHDTTR